MLWLVPSSAAAQENEVKSMNRSATGVMTGLAVGLAAGHCHVCRNQHDHSPSAPQDEESRQPCHEKVEGIVSDMAYIMKP